MKIFYVILLSSLLLVSCKQEIAQDFSTLTTKSPSIAGSSEYLDSPYVTAGDRVYMVGHQNGSFPELGWHIKDEMGGIWNHPIKLMDGFEFSLYTEDVEAIKEKSVYKLGEAHSFTNYPFANKFEYNWPETDVEIERWQFVPDGKQGAVIQLILKNKGEALNVVLNFSGNTDLRPTWLGERTQMKDGKDIGNFDSELRAVVIKDSLNPWYTVFGANMEPTGYDSQPSRYSGKGVQKDLIYSFDMEKNQRIPINFIVAGSYTSKEEAVDNYIAIHQKVLPDFISKKNRYNALAKQTKLTTPDPSINEAFEWLKYNCDWLVRTVPEIGSGIGAGIPDYPWWFGVDSEYALQGYMAIGQTEPVYNTIALLDSVSNAMNNNGRIIHEMSTNGAVFNPGNVNETPQFASLIWKVYQWNGDKAFLERYFPTIEKGLSWLLKENDANKNLFPDGYGMMEVHGMNSEMIDVAAYSQKAFADAALIAKELGKSNQAQEYSSIAEDIKMRINERFWNEEFSSYADFIGTDEQALKLIEDAIVRADTLNKPWAVAELQNTKEAILANPSSSPRPFVLHHNWVVNTPMEVGVAPPNKAEKALRTAEKFVNPFGVFVTGIDRDASAGSDDGSFKGSEIFSYTGAVMTLPTGVQIVSENNYGNPDKALNYLKRMTRTFSYALPGSMYEVSPDYGMMTQAWNIYGYAVPVVEQFFGIKPNAANKQILIAPQMPNEWNDAQLENVKVGDNAISVFFTKEKTETKIHVEQTVPGWELIIQMPNRDNTSFTVSNGTMLSEKTPDHYRVSTKNKKATLTIAEH